MIASNRVATAEPPRAVRAKIEILAPDEVRTGLRALRGRPLYDLAVLGLATGMRRGELVALRWGNVDLERGRIGSSSPLSRRTPA